MSRWRNYGLWVSIASFILLILQTFGVNVVPEQYNAIVNSFLGILVLAGILSNPTDGNGYIDTSKIEDED